MIDLDPEVAVVTRDQHEAKSMLFIYKAQWMPWSSGSRPGWRPGAAGPLGHKVGI